MGVLNISDLALGMVLADDIISSKGTKLLPKDLVLTERHIEIMKTWEVKEASIQGLSREDVARQNNIKVSEEDQAKIRAEVEMMFAGFSEDEVMNEIARVVIKLKIGNLAYLNTPDSTMQTNR